MRQLASQALGLPSEKVPSLDEKIAHTKERLASVEVPKEPSPEKGMAMLRKGYGENKLRKLRAQRARKLT